MRVVIYGPAASGKTRLARAIAQALKKHSAAADVTVDHETIGRSRLALWPALHGQSVEVFTDNTPCPEIPKPADAPPFWILWNPLSRLPPRVRFTTREEAERVAAECAEKWGAPVHVMRAESVFERSAPPVVKKTFSR